MRSKRANPAPRLIRLFRGDTSAPSLFSSLASASAIAARGRPADDAQESNWSLSHFTSAAAQLPAQATRRAITVATIDELSVQKL
jgi:hypothetical protein